MSELASPMPGTVVKPQAVQLPESAGVHDTLMLTAVGLKLWAHRFAAKLWTA